jgi:hypothetical protein
MKNFFVLFFCSGFYLSFVAQTPIKIIRDTLDESIPNGKYLVTGKISTEGTTINEANITTLSGRHVNSDKLGNFRILVDTSDRFLKIERKYYHTVYFEEYEIRDQHHIHIDVRLISDKKENRIVVKKPVIYCYSEENLSLEVRLFPKGDFLFTYPKIEEHTWKFQLENNQIVLDNGKKFPYLFWESLNSTVQYFTENKRVEGSVLKNTELVDFFEKSLAEMGLNENETTDFITFWVPQMMDSPYLFIQFLEDEKYASIAEIKISPEPENLKRIFMLFSKIEVPLDIEIYDQRFKKMKRNGLTIIEWGGAELEMNPTTILNVVKN